MEPLYDERLTSIFDSLTDSCGKARWSFSQGSILDTVYHLREVLHKADYLERRLHLGKHVDRHIARSEEGGSSRMDGARNPEPEMDHLHSGYAWREARGEQPSGWYPETSHARRHQHPAQPVFHSPMPGGMLGLSETRTEWQSEYHGPRVPSRSHPPITPSSSSSQAGQPYAHTLQESAAHPNTNPQRQRHTSLPEILEYHPDSASGGRTQSSHLGSHGQVSDHLTNTPLDPQHQHSNRHSYATHDSYRYPEDGYDRHGRRYGSPSSTLHEPRAIATDRSFDMTLEHNWPGTRPSSSGATAAYSSYRDPTHPYPPGDTRQHEPDAPYSSQTRPRSREDLMDFENLPRPKDSASTIGSSSIRIVGVHSSATVPAQEPFRTLHHDPTLPPSPHHALPLSQGFQHRADTVAGNRVQFQAPLEPEVIDRLDQIFFQFLDRICSDLKACDSKGDRIHQPLMLKKMQRLESSKEFRPFKFRIQAFTNAFHDALIQHGLTEDILPIRMIKLYLWKHRYISRFNEDGKKQKSKGNHVWNVEARRKRPPDEDSPTSSSSSSPKGASVTSAPSPATWEFKEYSSRIAGQIITFARVGILYVYAPRIWDAQMSLPAAKFSSPSLPPWLKWQRGELRGIPGPQDESCTITVVAEYVREGIECRLETSFHLTVSDPSKEGELLERSSHDSQSVMASLEQEQSEEGLALDTLEEEEEGEEDGEEEEEEYEDERALVQSKTPQASGGGVKRRKCSVGS